MGAGEVRGAVRLPVAEGSVRLARQWIALQLAMASPRFDADQVTDAMLAVSELVTNVLRHTDSAPALRCGERDGRFVVEVYDHHPDRPRMHPVDLDRPSGHGLRIVDALADSWGYTALEDGRKFVWFEMVGRR